MLFTSAVAGFKVVADKYKCKCMHVSVCVPSRRTNTGLDGIPGHLHCVLGEIDNPVDQVEGAKRKGEKDA